MYLSLICSRRKFNMSVKLTLVILGSIVGMVAIVLGGLLGFKILPERIEKKLQDNVRLKLSDAYREWETPPMSIETKFYFFDVKNPRNILKGGKPIINELAPIVYVQRRHKKEISYKMAQDTFTYDEMVENEKKTFYTNQQSRRSICTLNILKYMTLLNLEGKQLLERVKDNFNKVFPDTKNDDLFHNVNIVDFLFNGIESLPLKTATGINALLLRNHIVDEMKDNRRLEKSQSTNTYRFFPYQLGLNYKEYTAEVYGGAKNISQQGHIHTINGQKSLNVWEGSNSFCNSIRGVDSYTFNPNINVDQGIIIFNPHLCRFLNYAYKSETKVLGVTGQHMILMAENFQYPPNIDINKCFCIEEDGTCPSAGFLNITKCIDDIPLLVSQPHFLYTPQINADKMGFQPSVEKDVSYIDIHSVSGIVLSSSRKTQYNIWLRKIDGFNEYISSVMLPLFYVEENMLIHDKPYYKLTNGYVKDKTLVDGVKWGLLGSGAILFLGSVLTFVLSKLSLNNK